MITAKQAKEWAGPTPRERVEAIMPMIEAAAKKREREIHLHEDFWVNEGYSGTPAYKQATKILEELGYKVDFYYNDGSQFADIYTIVKW